ncbi:hypothetical protein BDW59DRAFT_154955 [Aspergillus cavernicola]|uniref:GET complex, subunit GET2 n=1 Tax=Aspergillus cavernicola TaxID=176166 RepID=A0ABR4HD09_9EURO
MSSAEESPAQRAARLRRERREAKIKEGGASRLDKISNLSGRTPSKDREDASPSPSLQPLTGIPSPSPEPRPTPYQAQQTFLQSPPAPSVEEASPDMLHDQQDILRALLRQPAPSGSQQGTEEDPTLKLLNALMGGMGGIPGAGPAADAGPGAGPGAPPTPEGPLPGGLSPELASSLGLPPWVSSMLGAATQQQSEEQKRTILIWKILHIVLSVAVGTYLVFLTSSSVSTYGKQPPPPATAQSPFLFFTTGELVLIGARVMAKGNNAGMAGPLMYIQLMRDFIRDGSIVLFLFGMGAWWNQGW